MLEIITSILVLITGFYAWATYKILRANERVVQVMSEQAEAMTRPYITIAQVLEVDNPIFYLRVSNTGRTPARNLRLKLDKSFYQFGEKTGDNNLAKYAAFNEPIDAFPPGAEITFSLAQSFKMFAEDADSEILPQKFAITAEYAYGVDKKIVEEHFIDLRPYRDADIPQDAVIRKLKDLARAVEKVALKLGRDKDLGLGYKAVE